MTANKYLRNWLSSTAKLILATAVFGFMFSGHLTWVGATEIVIASAALGGISSAVWAPTFSWADEQRLGSRWSLSWRALISWVGRRVYR
jgi:hypothetical protein